jgi:hypothetical protein
MIPLNKLSDRTEQKLNITNCNAISKTFDIFLKQLVFAQQFFSSIVVFLINTLNAFVFFYNKI